MATFWISCCLERPGRVLGWLPVSAWRERLECVKTQPHAISAFLGSLGLTLFRFLLPGLAHWLLLREAGQDVPLLSVIAAVSLASLVVLVPVSPLGIGVYEAALLFSLAPLGIAPEVSLSVAAVWRLAQLLCMGCFALWSVLVRPPQRPQPKPADLPVVVAPSAPTTSDPGHPRHTVHLPLV